MSAFIHFLSRIGCIKFEFQDDTRSSSVCFKLSEAFGRARTLLRDVGVAANVPIEPELQTHLIDETMKVTSIDFTSLFLVNLLFEFGSF